MLKIKVAYFVNTALVLVACSSAVQDTQTIKDMPVKQAQVQTIASPVSEVSMQEMSASTISTHKSYEFIKKRYAVKGSWSINRENGQNILRFDDAFKTKSGPDLKIYLSSHTIDQLQSDDVEATSVKIGVLKSNRGAQSYIIPATINLADYKSIVIHCQAFSVLWGGFNL